VVEANLLMLLDEGYPVRFTCSGDLYIVEAGPHVLYGASLNEALGKAIDATEHDQIREEPRV
jgi:hypothetical protein